MIIAIASDHAGFELKGAIKSHFPEHEFQDYGTYSVDAMDYPDTAVLAARRQSRKRDINLWNRNRNEHSCQ